MCFCEKYRGKKKKIFVATASYFGYLRLPLQKKFSGKNNPCANLCTLCICVFKRRRQNTTEIPTATIHIAYVYTQTPRQTFSNKILATAGKDWFAQSQAQYFVKTRNLQFLQNLIMLTGATSPPKGPWTSHRLLQDQRIFYVTRNTEKKKLIWCHYGPKQNQKA